MRNLERNRLLVEYRDNHAEVSWAEIGKLFKISGQRAWELYNNERKLRDSNELLKEGRDT